MLKLRKLTLLIPVALHVLSNAVCADSLTWPAAINEAGDKNPDILRAKFLVDQSVEQVKAAEGDLYPRLVGEASARILNNGSFSSGNSSGSSSGGLTNRSGSGGNTEIGSANLGITQNIYSGDRIPAAIREREAGVAGSRAVVQDVQSQVSFQLSASAAGLLASQRLVELSQEFIKRLTDNLNIVELRFENGSENKGSYLFAKASLEQSKYELLQANNGLRQAQQEFSRVIGRDGLDPVELKGDITERPLPKEGEIRGIAENTPAAKIAKAAREAAFERVTQAKSAFRPNLSANAAAGYQDREGGSFDTDTWSAGLLLTYPIFTGGRDTAALAAADADFMAAQSSFVSAVSTANSSLRAAYNRYMETIKKIEVDRSFVDAAQVRADIARSRYNNGLLLFEDWDIIEKDLISRKRSLVESRRQRVLAEAAFYQIIGESLFK